MKTVLITGASGYLGQNLCAEFHSRGWRVVGCVNCGDAPSFVDRVFVVDFLDKDPLGWMALREMVKEEEVDCLVNNAALHPVAAIGNMRPIDIASAVTVNALIPILMTQMIWPYFKARGGGFIINIGSLAEVVPAPGESVYRATKSALRAFSEGIQYECTQDNVKCLHVTMGALKEGMGAYNSKGIEPDEAAEQIVELTQAWRSIRVTHVTLQRRRY